MITAPEKLLTAADECSFAVAEVLRNCKDDSDEQWAFRLQQVAAFATKLYQLARIELGGAGQLPSNFSITPP